MKRKLYFKHIFHNIWKNSIVNIFFMVEHLFLLQQMLEMSTILVPTDLSGLIPAGIKGWEGWISGTFRGFLRKNLLLKSLWIFFLHLISANFITMNEKGEFFLNRRPGVAVSFIFLDLLFRSFRCKIWASAKSDLFHTNVQLLQ